MVNVILEGNLGRKAGKEWKLNVRTAVEAIKAIQANCDGFLAEIAERKNKYIFVIDGTPYYDWTALYTKIKKTLKLIPVLLGGAVIIPAIAAYVSFTIVAISTALTISTFAATLILIAGVALVAYGVYSLVTYLMTPDKPGDPSDYATSSFIFGGAENVESQGAAIPVGYGRMLLGSKIIGANDTSVDLAVWNTTQSEQTATSSTEITLNTVGGGASTQPMEASRD